MHKLSHIRVNGRGLAALALGAALLWASWPALAQMAGRWAGDPQYTHGWLVPLFSAYLLWRRREAMPAWTGPVAWQGLPLLALGVALYLAGGFFYYGWFCGLALLPWLAGLCVLFGGWPALRWAWPALGFLVFMLPLPYQIQVALGGPLQRLATVASTYLLQTLGLPALSEGNVILLQELQLGVVEACSGLGMLQLFFALCVAAALVVNRPAPDRALLVAAAVPIAVVVNVLRITATAVLHETAGSRLADLVFHDLAGWLMMSAALGLVWVGLRLLDRILVAPKPAPAPRPLFPTRGPRRHPAGKG